MQRHSAAGAAPLSTKVTDRPFEAMTTFNLARRRREVRDRDRLGRCEPGVRHAPAHDQHAVAAWATIESSRTLFAFAIPHACGEEPRPAAGWLPIQGDAADGADALSHHE